MSQTTISKKEVINSNPDKKKLINAVLKQLGNDDYIMDVVNHGANAGFGGFIYYSDTIAFYRKHRNDINNWVLEMAKEFDHSAVDFVCGFNCINDKEEANNVGRCLYNGKLTTETQLIENALAWFALEEVCRLFDR